MLSSAARILKIGIFQSHFDDLCFWLYTLSFEPNPSTGAVTFQLLSIYQPPLLTVTDRTKLGLLLALSAGDRALLPALGSLATVQRSTGQGLSLTAPTRPV